MTDAFTSTKWSQVGSEADLGFTLRLAVAVEVILDDFFVLADLLFKAIQSLVDGELKVFGASFAKVVHVAACEAAMGDAVLPFHTQSPMERNLAVKVFSQRFAALFDEGL